MNTTSENLATLLNEIVGLRKDERTLKLNRVSNVFYNYLKEFNHTFFKRDLLKSFFNSEVKTTTQNKILKDVLENLQSDHRILLKTIVRPSKPFLRNVKLMCFDYSSYSVLMNKNGYREVAFYNWIFNKSKKLPQKVFIKKLPFGVEPDFNFDCSELVQTKSRINQRVLTNSNKSLILTRSKNKNKVYFVL